MIADRYLEYFFAAAVAVMCMPASAFLGIWVLSLPDTTTLELVAAAFSLGLSGFFFAVLMHCVIMAAKFGSYLADREIKKLEQKEAEKQAQEVAEKRAS